MDYGKFKFDAAQRAKESRRKAVHVGIKEMKYRPKIGDGDFDTKTRQVAKFLEEGHKVKITIMFRGREVFHPELGKKILDRIADQMDGMGKSESVPRLDGRNMVMVLAPDKRAKQSAASRGPGHNGNGSAPRPGPSAGASGAGTSNGDGQAGSQDQPAAEVTGATSESASAAGATPAGVATPAETAGDGSPADESSEGEG
jgi:translation initiation factor IF-3